MNLEDTNPMIVYFAMVTKDGLFHLSIVISYKYKALV